jgi:hypothetical protein
MGMEVEGQYQAREMIQPEVQAECPSGSGSPEMKDKKGGTEE